jgi:holo-[acyl-carrier protein] synthase
MKKMTMSKLEIDGVGTDIIEIDRLKKAFDRRGKALIDKIFTEKEKKYCNNFKDPFPHFAVRFAAKEAVVKSFGLGFRKGITFQDIEILNDSIGKPYVKLSDELNKKMSFPKILLSLSHCNSYATAFCISKN